MTTPLDRPSSLNSHQNDFTEVLEVAAEAGHILLENGAEISRVEDIMARGSWGQVFDSIIFFLVYRRLSREGH